LIQLLTTIQFSDLFRASLAGRTPVCTK